MQRGDEDVRVALQPVAFAGRKHDVRRWPVPRFEGQPQAAAAADQLRAGTQPQAPAFGFEG
ncbi:hypothetical protein D3C81_2098420 [compost metagenome]